MNNKKEISRRGFLKTAAALGAALTIQPAINKVQAANAVLGGTAASSPRATVQQERLQSAPYRCGKLRDARVAASQSATVGVPAYNRGSVHAQIHSW